jgi:acid phosphatase type 7
MSLVFQVGVIVAALLAPTLADKPTGASCNDNTFPKQIRLAYAGHGGMAVSWNTNQQMTNPTVSFGKDPQNLNRQASSSISVTYPSSSTWNNHITISGLEPDATFYYMPQCENETFSFTTAPITGKGDAFQFAMIGDMGTMGPLGLSTTVGTGAANPLKPGDNNTIQSLLARKAQYEFVWHGQLLTPWIMYFGSHQLIFA